MAIGKKLLIFSKSDPEASSLSASTCDWGCQVTACSTLEELRGQIEGAEHDLVLVEDGPALRHLITDADPEGDVLRLPIAEIEKRHILRVLSSTGGNKTSAAKILGIDTKTLYNKLKAYGASAQNARRRRTQAQQRGDGAVSAS